MKRVFLGTIAMLMAAAVSLAGCSNETAKESAAPAASDNVAAETSESGASDENESAETPDETEHVEALDNAADTAESAATEIANGAEAGGAGSATPSAEPFDEALLGKIDNGIYKNEKVGFELTLPEGWRSYSPQEVRELNGGQGMIDGMLGLVIASPEDPMVVADFNRFMLHIQEKNTINNVLQQLNAQKEGYDMAMAQMEASASDTGPQIKIDKNTVEEKTVDGHTVYIATIQVTNIADNVTETIYQYIAEAGDYFVVSAIQTNNEDADKIVKKTMDSLKFSS